MNIKKLRLELEKLRRRKANLGQTDLERFAKKLGRKRSRSSTKEPQWISETLPYSRPVSIPGHKSIKVYTAVSILDRFEEDLDYLEEQFDAPEDRKEDS